MLKTPNYYWLLGIMFIILILGSNFSALAVEDSLFNERNKVVTDWEKSVVRAKGYGVAPDNISNSVQAKIMAREAAITMAQRRILEMIKGVKISSTQTVKKAQVQSDVIRKRVSGVIKGAQIIKEKQPADNVYQVVMEVKFYGEDGIMKAIFPEVKGKTKSEKSFHQDIQSSENRQPTINKNYTGIIINTVNLNVEPALAPKIYGSHDNLLYGMNKVTSQEVITDGIVGYSRSVAGAKNKSRTGKNPLIINAEKVRGEYETNLVLSPEDAQLVSRLGRKTDIFTKAKIIIVLT